MKLMGRLFFSYLQVYLSNCNHRKFLTLLLLVGLFGTTLNLRANATELEESEAPIQEVFLTELVYPQEKGEFQLTMTPQYSHGDEAKVTQLGLSMEYGITDQWQIGVELTPYIDVNSDDESGSGMGDFGIETKYSWMNVADNLHIAATLELQFPTGDIDKGLTEGFIELEPSIIVAKDFPSLNNSQLFLQAGFGFVKRHKDQDDSEEEEEPEAHEFNLNLGFFIPLESVTWTTELSWSTNTWNNDGEENTLYLTPGLVWNIEDVVEVGVGVPIGLNDDSDDYQAMVMFTMEWD